MVFISQDLGFEKFIALILLHSSGMSVYALSCLEKVTNIHYSSLEKATDVSYSFLEKKSHRSTLLIF